MVFIFTYASLANIYENKQLIMSFAISVKQNILFGMKTIELIKHIHYGIKKNSTGN